MSMSLPPEDKWHGVLIEADAGRAAAAKTLYESEGNDRVHCIHATVGLDGPSSLESLLATRTPTLPARFDLLSIDVDSFDYWIWEGMERYSADVVVVEFNPTIPNHVVFVQPRSTDIAQGASAAALVELAKRKGYRLCETTLYNAVFVRETLWHLVRPHCPDDVSLDALRELSMGTTIFQLYDGTVMLAGCKKLLWHRKPIPVKALAAALEGASMGKKGKGAVSCEEVGSGLSVQVTDGTFPFAPKQ